MTLKDLIASMSTIGDVLMMMPDVRITKDELRAAVASKAQGQLLGSRILEMGLITADQLERALTLQAKMRSAHDISAVEAFVDEVVMASRRAVERVGSHEKVKSP